MKKLLAKAKELGSGADAKAFRQRYDVSLASDCEEIVEYKNTKVEGKG